MSQYVPDRWVVLRFTRPDGTTLDKVLAGWYGGYLGSDAWQLNSGIKRVVEHNDHYEFHGYSGSLYLCYKTAYGFSGLMAGVLSRWTEQGINIDTLEEYDVRPKH